MQEGVSNWPDACSLQMADMVLNSNDSSSKETFIIKRTTV